jgi:C4-dicarboxylate transporter, DctQ subunit
MFVWMAKFGAAYGVRTGIHVGVDVVINRLPESARRKCILFGLAAGALFTGVVAAFGANFVWQLSHTDQTSPDMELPMWLVYLAIPCGSGLMCFRFLQVGWNFSRSGELPHHDPTQVAGVEKIADPDILPIGIGAEDNLHPATPRRKA